MIPAIILFVVGFALGLGFAFILKIPQAKNAKQLTQEIYTETESQRQQQINQVIQSVEASFGNLSLKALSQANEQLTELAKAKLETQTETGSKELESKKALIDQQLKNISDAIEKVGTLMNRLETDREQKFGQLASQLRQAGEQTNQLMMTTNQLKQALASTKARGQWGERMAEDVLRIVGFVENINYQKQYIIESSGKRPDYTFKLPRNLVVNMDVKFPLDNYMHYLECESSGNKTDAETHRKNFLRDVKNKISEVCGREYINPEQNTVDYVLLFIPNEQIYSFIHEQDNSILDEGLSKHVVFCSPITLYAILAVIRAAIDNFCLEQASREILSLLGTFNKQWEEFVNKMDTLGKQLEKAKSEFDALTTTRRRQLERPLNKIEELRKQKGISAPALDEISTSAEDTL
jgi:DNA recombination protein RmuC